MHKLLFSFFLLTLNYNAVVDAQTVDDGIKAKAGSVLLSSAQTSGSNIVATVNATNITQNQVKALQLLLQQQLRGQAVAEDLVIEQFVNMALLSQAAEKERMDKRADVIEALEFQRLNILSTLMQQELIKRSQPSEQQLEAAYDNMPNEEYRVEYIVVKDEMEANQIIKNLKDKVSFASLAKRHSVDPTGEHGGNLGWVNALQINSSLTNTLKSLKAGKYTLKPVSSAQGWQIIKLLEKRPFTKPVYFVVRDQLFQMLVQEKLINYIDALKSEAKITMTQ